MDANKKGRILIVDDNEDVLLSLNLLLKQYVEAVRVVNSPERIDEFMDSFAPDVIILDMNFRTDSMSGEEGYTWLTHILRRDPKAVVLFITAYVDTEKAVRAIKAGAIDFIPKPWNRDKLLDTVASAVELRHSRLEQQCTAMPQEATALIGECPAMRQLRQQIAVVAPTDANILITGENGTGKDVVAHLIHEQSGRSSQGMATIDLGSIPESLFEGELFGHEKGAFTDARTAKEGRVETADGGTLFLDEIGNLSASMQQKLLTMIEKREITRIGSTKTRRIDVRLICATNADLTQCANKGTFRQDLLYRINTISLHLPPLRNRGEDILLLAEHFAQQMTRRYGKPTPVFTPAVQARLMSHSWPGNVRELQHVIERAVILTPSTKGDRPYELTLSDDFFNKGNESSGTREGLGGATTLNLAELERKAIMQALELADGNLSIASESLGISRYALYRKIEKLKI